jgi:hypothetical protein
VVRGLAVIRATAAAAIRATRSSLQARLAHRVEVAHHL